MVAGISIAVAVAVVVVAGGDIAVKICVLGLTVHRSPFNVVIEAAIVVGSGRKMS